MLKAVIQALRLMLSACVFRMAVDDEWHCRLRRSIAIILLLFSLAQSLTCFNLNRTAQQGKLVNNAPVLKVRTGRILLNGKELSFKSRSSAAKANNGLSHVDSTQSDGPGKVLMSL